MSQNIAQTDDLRTYATPNLVFQNNQQDFQNVTADSGLKAVRVSRGASIADLNRDGKLDGVVLNSNALPTILRNKSRAKEEHSWVQLMLVGKVCNRDAVGSRVYVTANGHTQVQEVYSGRSYQGHSGFVLHFGLGYANKIDRVEVDWADGTWGNRELFEFNFENAINGVLIRCCKAVGRVLILGSHSLCFCHRQTNPSSGSITSPRFSKPHFVSTLVEAFASGSVWAQTPMHIRRA